MIMFSSLINPSLLTLRSPEFFKYGLADEMPLPTLFRPDFYVLTEYILFSIAFDFLVTFLHTLSS